MKNNVHLYRQWLTREIKLRFASSTLGPLWLILMPVAQISIFTLVFFEIFGMRWSQGSDSWANYGLNVFIGLSVFNFFGETLNRSAAIITAYPYLVTKVRFPLLLLPLLPWGVALLQLLISIGVVILWSISSLTFSSIAWSLVVLAILSLYGAAGAWLVAALGTYFRDVALAVPTLVSFVLFLSPIFYPSSAVPPALSPIVMFNPIAWSADELRGLWISGHVLQWMPAAIHAGIAVVLCLVSSIFYARLSKGFSDVL